VRDDLAELIRRQIDVVQRMQLRCEDLAAQRAGLFELVRGLWRRLSVLRDAMTESGDSPAAQRELEAVLREARMAGDAGR
jgi:hypothetical protein